MHDYNEIRKELKSKQRTYIFTYEGKYLFNSDDKNTFKVEKETKKQLLKYDEGQVFFFIKLSFHTGTRFLQAGTLKADVTVFKIKNGKIVNQGDVKPYSRMQGPVWFSKTFLEKYGWNNNYFDKIIKKLVSDKLHLSLISATTYEVSVK
jgi:hypothetical protein